jgi:hypothetical protein
LALRLSLRMETWYSLSSKKGVYSPDEKLEGGVGGLELVALVFQAFDFLEHGEGLRAFLLELEAERAGLEHDVGAAGQFADEDALVVADELGPDVFVTRGELVDGVDVDAALVREGGAADEGRAAAGALVGDLVDEEGEIAQLGEFFVAEDAAVHLKLEIGDAGDEVAVAGAFAVAVDRALDLRGARLDARERVGDAEAAIVVSVDAELGGAFQRGGELARDVGDLGGERAAVGVAHDKVGGAGGLSGLVTLDRIGGVELEAVEGVLAVEDDFAAFFHQISDGVADHGEIFLQRGAEDLGDVERGALADERDHGRAGFEEKGDLRVFFDRRVRAAGAAEGGELGVAELELFGLAEELDVLLVGAGPAALDVVHAEGVEALGQAQLVGEGKMDAFALRAVAERGVVKGDGG